jgi:hypothetical protein
MAAADRARPAAGVPDARTAVTPALFEFTLGPAHPGQVEGVSARVAQRPQGLDRLEQGRDREMRRGEIFGAEMQTQPHQ